MSHVETTLYPRRRTTVTCAEAAEMLHHRVSTIRRWCRIGQLSSVTVGKSRLISLESVSRLERLGSQAVNAQLRYASDDRGRAGVDLESDAEDAANRAKALAAIAKAKLAAAQRKDLAVLDAEQPAPTTDVPLDQIRTLNRLRVSLMLGDVGLKPASSMSDLELLQLAKRLRLAIDTPGTDVPPPAAGPEPQIMPRNWSL